MTIQDPDKQIGLYHKFDINPLHLDQEGITHEDCEYYVLDRKHDQFTEPALKALATATGLDYTQMWNHDRYLVKRADGSSTPGGKHENCEYYVLDLDCEPLVHVALDAYATACEMAFPVLSNHLKARVIGLKRIWAAKKAAE